MRTPILDAYTVVTLPTVDMLVFHVIRYMCQRQHLA